MRGQVAVTAAELALAIAIAIATLERPARAAIEPPIDRPTPVPGEVVLRGELRSSLDGSSFDAITAHDHFPRLEGDPWPRLGGLYDPAAGGLRVVEQDLERHRYRLVPSGQEGRACREVGVDSPCLAPRLTALAHERMVTADELAATLSGRIEAELLPAPFASVRLAGRGRASLATWAAASLAALLSALLWMRAARRARRDRESQGAGELALVRAAAKQARRALCGEPTLARARDQIQAVVNRAQALEQTRRACEARLARLNLARLDARRALWTGSAAPDAPAALATLDGEVREAAQLAADRAAAIAGLERMASSLRTLALRARRDRGVRGVAAEDDPVDALFGELDLREGAASEADDAARLPALPRR
jgi:hypothetical protein